MSKPGQPMNKQFQIWNLIRMIDHRNPLVKENWEDDVDSQLHLPENYQNVSTTIENEMRMYY